MMIGTPTQYIHSACLEQSTTVKPSASHPGMSKPGVTTTLTRPPTIRIGCLNVCTLSGKAETMMSMMAELDIDLLFLSETRTEEGKAKSLARDHVVHALEHPLRVLEGRAPYGQAFLINPSKACPEDFAVLEDDTSSDRCFSTVTFRGVTFVGVYLAPSRPSDWYSEKLESLSNSCYMDGPVILMGDFNARHTSFGDRTCNTYGNILTGELEFLGMQRLEPASGLWTFITDRGCSIPDHVFVNETALGTAFGLHVLEDMYVGGSDHRLMVFETFAAPAVATRPEAPRPWNRLRLKDPAVQERLNDSCGRSRNALVSGLVSIRDEDGDAQERVDAADAAIRRWLETGLRETVGLAPAAKPGWAQHFMTRELIASETVVRRHFDAWTVDRRGADAQQRYNLYHAHLRAHKALLAKRKRDLFNDFANRLAAMSPSEQMRTVSSMRRSRARRKGNSLKVDAASLDAYRDHYARQFVNNQPPAPEPPDEPDPAADHDMTETLDPIRIKVHLEMLARGKAAGNSGIPAEAMIATSDLISEPLSMLFTMIMELRVAPSSWKIARIHPVPKKGDLSKIENYRPISLTEAMRKLFESLLLPILKQYLEPLSVEQGGFRSLRGTNDQITTLHEWIVQSKSAKLPRYMAFLDIKAAYDQVDRSLLWHKCLRKRVPANVLAALQALFDHNAAFVAINGHRSSPFQILSGVLQGSLLSPILYSAFIDDLAELINASEADNGIGLNGRRYRLLLYADDIVLISNDKAALSSMLRICDQHATANRYRFNVAKCEVVSSEARPQPQDFFLDGSPIPLSETFTYLGCTFDANGINWDEHWKRIVSRALGVTNSVTSAGLKGRSIGVTAALSTFRTFVRPVLEYCLAMCPKSSIRKASTGYNKCIRWMASSGYGAAADVIGLFGNMEPFAARHERLGSRFWGRVNRLAEGEGHMAVVDALREHERKSVPGSVFKGLKRNPSVRAWRRVAQREEREAGENSDENDETDAVELTWPERKEQLMNAVTNEFMTGYIFGGHDKNSRKLHHKAYSAQSPNAQHAILLWTLNRATGTWRYCWRCRTADGTKAHVERCILGIQTEAIGPSNLEDRLFAGREDRAVHQAVADEIRRCIGETPVTTTKTG